MKILIMIGDSVIGKYFATRINNEVKTLATIVENKKQNKIKILFKKLKKNPFLAPYKIFELFYLSLDNRIIARKTNNYFLKYNPKIIGKKYIVNNINSDKTKEIIRLLKPDLGVIAGTSIIKQDVINLFPKGLLNLHTGILPNYRGLRGEFWALYNKDYNNIGVSIIKIDKNIDSGDIVLQEKIKYNKNDNEFTLRCRNIELGIKLMIKAVKNIGKLKTKVQKNGDYYSNPSLFEMLKFRLSN